MQASGLTGSCSPTSSPPQSRHTFSIRLQGKCQQTIDDAPAFSVQRNNPSEISPPITIATYTIQATCTDTRNQLLTSIGEQFTSEIDPFLVDVSSQQRPSLFKEAQEHFELNTCDVTHKNTCDVDFNQKHINQNIKESSLTCLCGKSYKYKTSFDRHFKERHEEWKHKCQICNRPFNRKETLMDHIRAKHTKEKPFNCHFCDQQFSTRRNLNIHKKIKHREACKPASSARPKTE